jgi:hypothetical protein
MLKIADIVAVSWGRKCRRRNMAPREAHLVHLVCGSTGAGETTYALALRQRRASGEAASFTYFARATALC